MTDPEKPPTITMRAIKDGSIHGVPFQAGDTLEVHEQDVTSMELMGLAVRQAVTEPVTYALGRDPHEAAQEHAQKLAADTIADREAVAPRNPVSSS